MDYEVVNGYGDVPTAYPYRFKLYPGSPLIEENVFHCFTINKSYYPVESVLDWLNDALSKIEYDIAQRSTLNTRTGRIEKQWVEIRFAEEEHAVLFKLAMGIE